MKSHTKFASTFSTGISVLLFGLALFLAMGSFSRYADAQEATDATAAAAPSAAALSPEELDEMVGRIALYPDELISIVLPASTYPLQIVQASRFLEKQKTDDTAKPDEAWDASVLGLLNYPEVIDQMNSDLDWTWALGDAVVNQQQDVMTAIQTFREKVDEAGNLESNDNVVIIKETQVIKIESASPEVIYVPTYNPTTVVVYSPAPYPYYYSPPYPYYYSPAATFWTGMFIGAAISYGVHWHGGGHRGGDIDINRNTNININSKNVDRDSMRNNNRDRSGGNNWNSDRRSGNQGGRPGQGNNRSGGGAGLGGQSRQGGGIGGNNRSGSSGSSNFGNRSPSASGNRFGDSSGGRQTSSRTPSASSRTPSASSRTPSASSRTPSRQQGSAGSFGDYQRGSSATRSSQRGSSSRSGMSSSSRGSMGGRSRGGGGRRR